MSTRRIAIATATISARRMWVTGKTALADRIVYTAAEPLLTPDRAKVYSSLLKASWVSRASSGQLGKTMRLEPAFLALIVVVGCGGGRSGSGASIRSEREGNPESGS